VFSRLSREKNKIERLAVRREKDVNLQYWNNISFLSFDAKVIYKV